MKIIEIDLNYIADEDSVIALGNFTESTRDIWS